MATNENLIPIPGRLHSVATEGHVAGADEIYDDTIGKTQAEINQTIEPLPDSLAYLGDDDGQAVIPGFDPQTDTLHKAAQVLTTAEKDQVAQNLNNRPSTNGMARIELKATDNFKSVVEAQTGGNTVFVIKYDFTLTGNVTVPANCVLEFDGGSISGDGTNKNTITGTDTQIRADKVAIFTGITIGGTWNVPYITSNWFGDATTRDDVIKSVFNLASDSIYNEIVIEKGDYWVSRDEETGDVLLAKSNTRYIINGNIRTRPNSQNYTRTIYIYEKENVTIEGSGYVYGDKLTHIYYDGNSYPDGYIPGFIWSYGHNPTIIPDNPEGYASHENCHGIEMSRCNNITIKDISIYDCVGDCLNIKRSKYVTVKNVHLENGRRQGCSMSGSNIIFENVTIKDIKGTAPESGIDIETSLDETVVMSENIIFRNMSIQGVSCGITATGNYDNYNKILIQNVHVKDAARGLSIHNFANKVLVENSSFDVTVRGSKVYPERFLHGIILSQVHLRDCYINVNVPYIKPGFDPSDESMVKNYSDYLTYNIEETEETEEDLKDLYTAIETEVRNVLIDGCRITSNVGSIKGSVGRLFIKSSLITGGAININSGESISILGNRLDIDGKISGIRMFIVGNDIGACKRIEGSNVSFVGNYINFKNSNEGSMFYTDYNSRVIGNRITVDDTVVNKLLVGSTSTTISNNYVAGAESIIKTTNTTGNAYNNFGPSGDYPEQYAIRREGSTRPTAPQAGFQFFDTTLGKPIYWNGSAWVDATGTIV